MTFNCEAVNFFNQPHLLTEEQRHNPLSVMAEFFVDIHLCEIREFLDEVQHVCMTTDDPPFSDAANRDEFLMFRGKIEGLIQAAFIIYQQNNKPAVS